MFCISDLSFSARCLGGSLLKHSSSSYMLWVRDQKYWHRGIGVPASKLAFLKRWAMVAETCISVLISRNEPRPVNYWTSSWRTSFIYIPRWPALACVCPFFLQPESYIPSDCAKTQSCRIASHVTRKIRWIVVTELHCATARVGGPCSLVTLQSKCPSLNICHRLAGLGIKKTLTGLLKGIVPSVVLSRAGRVSVLSPHAGWHDRFNILLRLEL